MRLGVLDIGSNTVHLLIVDAHYGAAPIPASKRKVQLRLAQHIGPDGSIDQGLVEELIAFIQESQTFAEDMGVTELMAFATSAIREARNGADVLAQVRAATGLSIVVLSGDEEARLTFLAVRRWFGWSSGRLLVMDIGGGSLELASGTDEEPDAAVSLELGAGRMTREFLHSDPVHSEEMRALRKHARAAVGDVVGALRRVGEPRLSAATSKTFKQLARIAGAPPESDGPYARRTLKYSDVRDLVTLLSSKTVAERTKLPGVSVGRAAQLLAGAVVAEAAMDLLAIEELAVCPWALREGVILRHMDGLPR
jgi:exopolyphosphatase/guanosine-5'-triphosphate,3'-diphosphate pyrophosphatase